MVQPCINVTILLFSKVLHNKKMPLLIYQCLRTSKARGMAVIVTKPLQGYSGYLYMDMIAV